MRTHKADRRRVQHIPDTTPNVRQERHSLPPYEAQRSYASSLATGELQPLSKWDTTHHATRSLPTSPEARRPHHPALEQGDKASQMARQTNIYTTAHVPQQNHGRKRSRYSTFKQGDEDREMTRRPNIYTTAHVPQQNPRMKRPRHSTFEQGDEDRETTRPSKVREPVRVPQQIPRTRHSYNPAIGAGSKARHVARHSDTRNAARSSPLHPDVDKLGATPTLQPRRDGSENDSDSSAIQPIPTGYGTQISKKFVAHVIKSSRLDVRNIYQALKSNGTATSISEAEKQLLPPQLLSTILGVPANCPGNPVCLSFAYLDLSFHHDIHSAMLGVIMTTQKL
jgi:hypothetical protein